MGANMGGERLTGDRLIATVNAEIREFARQRDEDGRAQAEQQVRRAKRRQSG